MPPNMLMNWSSSIDIIQPHVVRISTPRGSGTGFLIKTSPICGIATAAHVINQAYYWEEPIRIDHISSGQSVVLHHVQGSAVERVIFCDDVKDTAIILFNPGPIPFPPIALPLTPPDQYVRMGIEIGWLGFPGIVVPSTPCFFVGRVSAFLRQAGDQQGDYLVDGVAIHGVSGSPAFLSVPADSDEVSPLISIMGVVTGYQPNRMTGEALPGLSVVRHLSSIHASIAVRV